MNQNNVIKEQFLEAINDGRVVITGSKMTAKGWTGFNVWIVPKEKDENMGYRLWNVVVPESPYWSEKNHFYHCTAWGTSRPLEIYLSVCSALGLSFAESKQNYQLLL